MATFIVGLRRYGSLDLGRVPREELCREPPDERLELFARGCEEREEPSRDGRLTLPRLGVELEGRDTLGVRLEEPVLGRRVDGWRPGRADSREGRWLG